MRTELWAIVLEIQVRSKGTDWYSVRISFGSHGIMQLPTPVCAGIRDSSSVSKRGHVPGGMG